MLASKLREKITIIHFYTKMRNVTKEGNRKDDRCYGYGYDKRREL